MRSEEVSGHRRREMTEEMTLNYIASQIASKGDTRLLSGSRYESLFRRIEQLKVDKILGMHLTGAERGYGDER